MLYTERHGIRTPIDKTYSISREMYRLLFNCCKNYQKNLTHMFHSRQHDDFTNSDYNAFDEQGFIARLKIRIPALHQDKYNRICIPNYKDNYDQYALLDYIEFFAQNIRDISEYWNNERYRNFLEIECLNTINVLKIFQNEINDILIESGLLYTLTDENIIERIVENSPLTPKIQATVSLVSEVGTRELLKDAIALYKTPGPAARQDSVEKIWDALERLKTYYTYLDKKDSVSKIVNDMGNGQPAFITIICEEFKTLTKIGNNYRIRHHETEKIDIIDVKHYDYFFNRCLSLIGLAVQYLQ